MPREPDVFNDQDLFDSIILGGLTSPGVVKLSGHDRKVNWDVKAGKGLSGASTTLKDVPLIEFTATFFLADDEDFAAWPAFRALINSTITGKGKALDIYHPDLEAQDINSVVKGTVGGTVHDGKGGRTIVVKFQEYKPPKPAVVTPLGSRTKPADPDAAAKAELAALTAQYNRTPWDGGPTVPRNARDTER